jgi:hypothetical protein
MKAETPGSLYQQIFTDYIQTPYLRMSSDPRYCPLFGQAQANPPLMSSRRRPGHNAFFPKTIGHRSEILISHALYTEATRLTLQIVLLADSRPFWAHMAMSSPMTPVTSPSLGLPPWSTPSDDLLEVSCSGTCMRTSSPRSCPMGPQL